MSNTYNESIHFVGPAEQISLVLAHLDIEICGVKKWLHFPYVDGQHCVSIEEVTASAFKLSVFAQLDGSSLDYYFECLSCAFPGLLMIGSSYCPYMGELEFEAWFGGKPTLSDYMLLVGCKRPTMINDTNLDVPIMMELLRAMNDALVAAEVSFASGCRTPRKALRILEQTKAQLDFRAAA